MIYRKDKIKRLISYKDTIEDENVKMDLQWLIGQYNQYYLVRKDYKDREEKYNEMSKTYYDMEEEKMKLYEEVNKQKKKNNSIKS